MSELSNQALPTAIFLMGPTATGKTDVAVTLHHDLPVELVSVDSVQVYRGMDIGAAKPSPELLHRVPHQLIDIRDPSQPYSVADFIHDAHGAMARITERGNTPLLVGGTMLYFKALLEGLADSPPADSRIRQVLEQEAVAKGWPFLHRQLAEVDPELAAQLHPNHSQRIQRGLEVYRSSGKTLSQFQREQRERGSALRPITDSYNIVQVALLPKDRQALHQRIECRFNEMLAQGFEAEVRQLYERGDLYPELPSIRAVGYRQMWQYFDGVIDYAEMRQQGIAASRQLAKRQLTWLRKWAGLHQVLVDYRGETNNILGDISTKCLKIIKKYPYTMV